MCQEEVEGEIHTHRVEEEEEVEVEEVVKSLASRREEVKEEIQIS